MASLVLVLSLLLSAAETADVSVISLLKGEVAVPLSPSGKASLKRDGTVTRVRVELERLGPPSALGAAYNTYVVWAVAPEGGFENIGEILTDKDKGRLDATTRFEQVGLLITAEPHF